MKRCASVHRSGGFAESLVAEAAIELRQATGGSAKLAFAFVTPDYLPFLEEFSEIVRVDGHVIDLIGATGQGLTANGEEDEEGKGFSLLAVDAESASFSVQALHQSQVESIETSAGWQKIGGSVAPRAWVVLANPFIFDSESWLSSWNAAYPGVPSVGGLATGSESEEETAVFWNGKVHEAIVVGVNGLRVVPLVSQGCRPIGEPLTVTKAENNIVYALGSHPAYEALESAFEGLTDGEKASARGNLFAGLAGTEYVEDFKPGDFIIRNILGADPNSGAVVIGGIPRVGQTLQYQLRDRDSADTEWRSVLRHASLEFGTPQASLLFACSGRGSNLFGSKSHDAGLLEEILGDHASAGFFCNGEIGPLVDKNHLHTYTASCALFFEEKPEL